MFEELENVDEKPSKVTGEKREPNDDEETTEDTQAELVRHVSGLEITISF